MGNHYFDKPDRNSNLEEKMEKTHSLILYNDDHNEYNFVIECLIDVCKHTECQAEQCTLIAHHKGKCDVKRGDFTTLDEMRNGLIIKGINAEVVNNN
ncbi:MAG: ATP-dependent Clp protease adaptor ClpS [Bacteroidales bacterium]|nr:ATP-dependent Clp protease adaptor ClpS [Bacteroidales bacterium]